MVIVGTLCAPASFAWNISIVTGIIAFSGYLIKVLAMLFFDANYSAQEFWYWGFDHWTFGMISVFIWYTGVRLVQYSYARGTSFFNSCFCGDEHTVYVTVTEDQLEDNPKLAAVVGADERHKLKKEILGTRRREASSEV